MTSACPITPEQIEAYFDGEVDALGMAEIERHLAQCAACGARLDELTALRILLRTDGVRHTLPDTLKNSIGALGKDGLSRRRPAALSWLGGGVIGALAASLALLLVLPQLAVPPVGDEVVSAHLRSLQPGHLIDVATSDRHVVKPWFNGKVDFAPTVVELADDGYPLIGGRLDVVDGSTVAVLVYGSGRHIISLYVLPRDTGGQSGTSTESRFGYNVAYWSTNGLSYRAVSDIPLTQLEKFRRDFVSAEQGNGPGVR